jgi:hypothetical protein
MSDIPATSTNDAKAGAELSTCDSSCARHGETRLDPDLRVATLQRRRTSVPPGEGQLMGLVGGRGWVEEV